VSDDGRNLARLLSPTIVNPPIVRECEKPEGASRPLDEWRKDLVSNRAGIIGNPGVYLDRSPTGCGKSHSDIEACKQVAAAIVIVPTHENAKESEEDMQKAGLDAMKYPGRMTSGDEANCMNAFADTAEAMGFSVVDSVCQTCKDLAECLKTGYRAELVTVQTSKIVIATFKRAEYNGFDKLVAGRLEYISSHEDAAGTLCPTDTISESDLQTASSVLNRILNDPDYLNWLGQSARKDEDGKFVPDEKLEERRNRIDEFIRNLADVIDLLIEKLKSAEKTQAVEIPKTLKKPIGAGNLLFSVCLDMGVTFSSGSWRLILAAASGELYSVGVIVDGQSYKSNSKDGSSPKSSKKMLIGCWRNLPPVSAVAVFSDATMTAENLENYFDGRTVTDITPSGHVERSHQVIQIPQDITRRTSKAKSLSVIRGILAKHPDAKNVGIITHRTIIPYLKHIGEPFASRIKMSTHFGSGQDRASNDWYTQCDLIVVLGTPRVPPIAIQQRLVQFGDFAAAGENPDWGDVFWRGQTPSGREKIVTSRGHRHPVWSRAHRSLVRAAIIQAAGRGRPLLDAGCPVAIVSTEECGFPIADETIVELSESETKTLTILKDLSLEKLTPEKLTLENTYSIYKEKQALTFGMTVFQALTIPISTNDISHGVGLSEQRSRAVLAGLESRKLVSRVGDRGGWLLTDVGFRLVADSAIQTEGQTA
jgi:hypothetical protein